ncbi:hypothetical protein B0H14DRAFT_2946770, partial [Mycena olivaceomarginata]
MYPSSQVFPVSVSGIVALAAALFHGQEDHDDDVYRPFVSGFDGIERRAALISSRFLCPVPTPPSFDSHDSDQLTSASTSR